MLESAYSFMLKYSKITVCLGSLQVVLRQSSPQAVLRQSPLLLWQHNMCRNWPIIQWFTNLICINWQWHQHGTSKHKFRYNLFLGCNPLMGIGQPLKISYFVGLVVVVLNWIKQTHFESWLWQLSGSHQAVSGSCHAVLRQSIGSH